MTLRYPPSTHSHTHTQTWLLKLHRPQFNHTVLEKNIYLNKAWNESVQSSISSFTLFLPYLKSSGISNLKLLPSSLWMKLNHTERQWLILSEHSGFHGVYLPSYIAQSITSVCSFMRKENANKCMCVTSTSHWKPNITHCVFQSSYLCRYKHLSPPMLFLHTYSPYSCLCNYTWNMKSVTDITQESYFLHVVLTS